MIYYLFSFEKEKMNLQCNYNKISTIINAFQLLLVISILVIYFKSKNNIKDYLINLHLEKEKEIEKKKKNIQSFEEFTNKIRDELILEGIRKVLKCSFQKEDIYTRRTLQSLEKVKETLINKIDSDLSGEMSELIFYLKKTFNRVTWLKVFAAYYPAIVDAEESKSCRNLVIKEPEKEKGESENAEDFHVVCLTEKTVNFKVEINGDFSRKNKTVNSLINFINILRIIIDNPSLIPNFKKILRNRKFFLKSRLLRRFSI